MKYSFIYIVSIVIVNLAFDIVPPAELSDGTIWSVGSILAGAVFVARDFAQREVGHIKVLGLMVAAGLISYLMASPFVAIASIVAFSASELCDYLVFTCKKGSFKLKVIMSGLISVPVDTFIFLFIIEQLSSLSLITMIASKFLALLLIFKIKDDE